ncbi:MAG: hypothetical protein LH702_14945 [Phormidesmis sp. CAN_BIN44]|nr:hypothetical protein [Phormidesmis sp. CAN_BIN44]
MTEPATHLNGKSSARSAINHRSLNFHETYLCPVCRHGQIAELTLMDAFACNFCRHIFTANLREQSIHVEDSSQPMTWRWNGRNWQAANQLDVDLTLVIWIVGAILVVLPPALIFLSSRLVPPLEGSTLSWLPNVWVGLTFLTHFSFVAWLMVEHYQLPIYVSSKVRIRQWLERR